MQISLKWTDELVSVKNINLEDLISKLTLGGFEVEDILELNINNKNQIILDISATANRSDSLSIQGISSEISSLLDQPIKISNYTRKTKDWKQNIEDIVEIFPENSNCSMFLSVIIENLTNTNVPDWITQKLKTSDIIPLNNLLDFQNYILLETGYPFVFYDFEKISSKLKNSKFNLSILNAKNNQTFLASNNISYELDNSILTINANDLIIGIAGITEAKEFAYSESTNKLLIEGSIFNASKIRQQSRNLGLRTNRSARYEKALKNIYLIESLYRLISLLRISNPELVCKIHTAHKTVDQITTSILLRYETIKEILGPINDSTSDTLIYISPKMVTHYLNRLNFKSEYTESKFCWKVGIPNLRNEDLTREIDLIEEIGRLHGFNNFLTTLPKIKVIGTEDSNYKTRKKITECLLNLGFNELIHYSLVNQPTVSNNEVKLINPLISDCSYLRTSLLPNLIKTLEENLKQKNISVEGFEYGHVFYRDLEFNFKEKEYVSGIFGGIKIKSSWSHSEKFLTWFEAKGKIEQLFNQLNLVTYWEIWSKTDTENILHPYRTANLYLTDGTSLGKFGQIHPIVANKLNLSSEIYLFEFDLEIINFNLQKNRLPIYKEYSVYPKIIKDLSFIVQKDIRFKNIQDALYQNGTEFLYKINLLDEYQGHSVPKNHTSICLQLIFQSNKTTLENKKIESIISKLQLVLTEKFHAIIRN